MDENGLGKEGVKYTPQEAWMNVIRSSIDNAPAGILASLTLLGTLDNVPRKEKQFRNFTSNSLRLRHNNALVGKLWDHLLQTRAEGNLKQRSLKLTAKGEVDSNDLQNSNDIVIAQPSLPTSETTSPHVDETKVIKKNSAEEADQSTRTNKNRFLSSHDIDNSKLVKKAISKMLRKAPGHRMKIKQLRKQIRAVLMVQKDKRKELKRLVKDALGSNSRVKNIRVEGREVLLLI